MALAGGGRPTDLQLTDRLTYEYLVRSNADGSEIVPNVAKSWDVGGRHHLHFSLRRA